MPNQAIATLTEILRPEIDLGKSRLETLCLIVIGMVSARSVNLSHIACERTWLGADGIHLSSASALLPACPFWSGLGAAAAGRRLGTARVVVARTRPHELADRKERGDFPHASRRHSQVPGASALDGDREPRMLRHRHADYTDQALSCIFPRHDHPYATRRPRICRRRLNGV